MEWKRDNIEIVRPASAHKKFLVEHRRSEHTKSSITPLVEAWRVRVSDWCRSILSDPRIRSVEFGFLAESNREELSACRGFGLLDPAGLTDYAANWRDVLKQGNYSDEWIDTFRDDGINMSIYCADKFFDKLLSRMRRKRRNIEIRMQINACCDSILR